MNPSFHLVGIAGTGMSALADFLADLGYEVSGSDRFLDHKAPLPVLETLRARGLRLFPQDGSGVRPGLTAVVVSSAIESDNPDLRAAQALGIPVEHRATVLANGLVSAPPTDARLVAVAGTSGKSTTTAILGHLLSHAGLSPVVVNGAACPQWTAPGRTGAVLAGTGRFRVFEADESDRSLLKFNPYAALVLNSSADHFPLAETDALFNRFLQQVSGPVVDARRRPAPEVEEGDWSVSFPFHGERFTLPLPGRHNATDAFWACEVALQLGVPVPVLKDAIASFHGVSRRLECVGVRADGVRVVDDYAHNTEKLRAAITTLQARSNRLLAVWRPHGYAPLRKMRDDLANMFASILRPDDHLFLLPVFDAGGTAVRDVSSEDLATDLSHLGVRAAVLPDPDAAFAALDHLVRPGDLLATFGARDPDLPALAHRLVQSEPLPLDPANLGHSIAHAPRFC